MRGDGCGRVVYGWRVRVTRRGEVCSVRAVRRCSSRARGSVPIADCYWYRRRCRVGQETSKKQGESPLEPSNGYPSQPLYGSPSRPYYDAPQRMPLSGVPPTVPLPRRESFHARRFVIGGIPLWAGIAALILVVATFVYGVFALNKDWAESAWIAAFVTLVGAGVILIASIVLLVEAPLPMVDARPLGAAAGDVKRLWGVGAHKPVGHPPFAGARPGEQPAMAGMHP